MSLQHHIIASMPAKPMGLVPDNSVSTDYMTYSKNHFKHPPSLRTQIFIQGVLVSPQAANSVSHCHDAVLANEKISSDLIEDTAWKDLALPKVLGLPLTFVRWPTPTRDANYNHLVQVMSIDADPSSPDDAFGKTAFPPILSGVMLVRSHGVPLKEKHVEVLAQYADPYLKELIEVGGERSKHKISDEIQKLGREIEAKVSPVAFVTFGVKCVKMKVDGEDQSWTGLKCPVNVPLGQLASNVKSYVGLKGKMSGMLYKVEKDK